MLRQSSNEFPAVDVLYIMSYPVGKITFGWLRPVSGVSDVLHVAFRSFQKSVCSTKADKGGIKATP